MNLFCKKAVVCLSVSACMAGILTGCKPSEKKVLASSYYQELNAKYENLKKENEVLQMEVDESNKDTEESERIKTYLKKISRGTIAKLEVGYADNMEGSEFVEEKGAFSLAIAIAKRADRTERYTVETLQQLHKPVYQYILYDESNAIYEMTIYEGDYIVMSDLPNEVFYAYNASALGEAFLHYKQGYPNSKLLHRMADSVAIVDDKKNCFEQETAFFVANTIDRIEDKKKSSGEKAKGYWEKIYKKKGDSYEPASSAYTFFHHGNQMKLTLYDVYICIENMDESETWYRVDKEDVKKIKAFLNPKYSVLRQLDSVSDAKTEQNDSTSEAETTETQLHELD